MDREKKIIESWTVNAANWIDLIDKNGIESRRLVTNKSIINAVLNSNPTSVLDIGCGEGWLAKELHEKGIEITGIDIVPALIENAKQKIQGNFIVASYEDLASGKIYLPGLFNAIVINFAMIAKESVENLLVALPPYLAPKGKLFIQTLHPSSRKLIDDYISGWKEGSWEGLGEQFTMPYQWYFRTLEDWLKLLNQSGFHKTKVIEVMHPHSAKLLSVIFECDI